MATKNTTNQIVVGKVMWEGWYKILEARVRDLSNDSDHTLSWKDRAAFNKGVTRRQIVTIYETAYSELAESFVGHLEQINELENQNINFQRKVDDLNIYVSEIEVRLETSNRQVNGLLKVIEEPVSETTVRPWT